MMNDKHLNDSILKIASGVNQFQSEIFKGKEELFKSLAKKQQPKILFITCSDSRIDPALITQTQPGDMFLIQNAGNIVPPHGSACDGIGASIEYAVAVLEVEHIIICGHSACGAMNALLNKSSLDNLPAVKQWLSFAEATGAIFNAQTDEITEEGRLNACTQMNILVQMANLKTLPSVASKLYKNKISIHGWLYQIESGDIDVYDSEANQFVSFSEAYPVHSVV